MRELKNIMPGDYPDPSIIYVDDCYYLVSSTFEYTPGLTIWKSVDLVNFEIVANPVTTYLGTIFAPDLVYHNGRFFIYYPVINKGGNYVIYADNIEGPWSEPIPLGVKYIDPGHIVADDGTRYLYLSTGKVVQLSPDGLSVPNIEYSEVYNGWEFPDEWEVECFGLEGPKLFKRNNYFYMVSAQGGTAGPATSHMAVLARATHPLGPWENAPNNPVLSTKSDQEKWWSKGHSTIFQGRGGQWYMVYHGYEKGYHTLGRQSLISKIKWTDDDWCYLEEIENFSTPHPSNCFIDFSDDFTGNESTKLKPFWRFYQHYNIDRCSFSKDGMAFMADGESLADTHPLLCNPYSHSYQIDVTVTVNTTGAEGGLTLYYSPSAYIYFGAGTDYISTGTMLGGRKDKLSSSQAIYYLRLTNRKNMVTFSYSLDNINFSKIYPVRNVSGFNHNTFAKFLSLKAGIYSCGNENSSVIFKDFKYTTEF